MAEVDPGTDAWLAHTRGVVGAVRAHADYRGEVARRLLAQHTSSGDSRIVVVKSTRPDAFVCLDDDGGQGAAMSIEFGRHEGGKSGGMDGLHILGRAFGI
jgi:hypothetical protein